MVLAIDVGNTNIVLGCIDKGEIASISRMATDKQKTGDQYAYEFKNLLDMHGIAIKDFSGSVISSVVPSLTNSVAAAVRLASGLTPVIVGPGVKTGLNIRMDEPSQLGADLVAEAVACQGKYKNPLIIADLGTATTLAVINRKGDYIGGCIAPGVNLSLAALASSTAQLPDISLTVPKNVIGTNTTDSMRSGLIYGIASLLDGMIDRISIELKEEPTVVITGGMGSVINGLCRHKTILDEELVLKGLYKIYIKNSGDKDNEQ